MTSAAAAKSLRRITDPLVDRTRSKTVEATRRYRLDPLAHVEDGHVYVPDLIDLRPTVLEAWPHQEEIAREWIDLDHLARTGRAHPELAELRYRNVVEEKSRRMGVTVILAYLDWWALKYYEAPGLVTHLEFSKVDDGGSGCTPESYFGKIRFVNDNMPLAHRAPLSFKLGLISHAYRPLSYLVAEGADPEAGRGGGYLHAVIDEAARLAYGEAANRALQRAIPNGRFYNSTPSGDSNVYARLAKKPPKGFRKLRHHWSQHPLYGVGLHFAAVPDVDERGLPQEQPEQLDATMEDVADRCSACDATRRGVPWDPEDAISHRYPGRLVSRWYDEVVAEMTDDDVAMELEIDYAGMVSARVYPEFDETIHVVDRIERDPSRPVELAFDYGLHTSVLILQDLPYEVHAIGEVEIERDAVPEDVDALLRVELLRLGYTERELGNPTHTLAIPAVGDPAGEQKQQATARSLVTDYRKLGWNIYSTTPREIKTTILAGRRLLLGRPKRFFASREGCPGFVEHAKQNRWPVDRQGNRKPNPREPENNRHNHIMRAWAYWTAERFPPLEPAERDVSEEERAVREQRRLIAQVRAKRAHGHVSYDTRL